MSCKFLCAGSNSKKSKKSNMYSDSSSTTGSESEENFPGYIPVPMMDEEVISATYGTARGCDRTKMYQAYKGQLKLSAYINYGLLTVHVAMGRHLKSKFKSTCDSFIKLSLVPDDTRRTQCKTEVIHDTNNPLYDEKFSFELLEEDGPKRLFISVWHRDIPRNQSEFLGCMSFGVRHIQSKQKTIQGWYYLLNGDIGRRKHLQVTDRKHLSEGPRKVIPEVNQDVLWMEPCVLLIKRGKSGFGFTINGSCPVTVCRVESGSTADKAGVKPGDCIVRIDGANVSRSTCDSVARIIKHCQKKIVLEVQRPKKVETTFQVEELDQSPRQPLGSINKFTDSENVEDMVISPWKPPARRTLDTVVEEETPPTSPERGYATQHYGWIDGGRRADEEDIYVEPDEIRAQVLRVPQDPPALPPNHPTMSLDHRHKKKLGGMVVSPWKPPQGHMPPNGHMLDGHMPRNGHMPDGHMPNGHMTNGHMPNGHMPPKGHMPNGHMTNGHMPPHGHMPNGHMPHHGHMSQRHSRHLVEEEDPYMPLNGVKNYRETDLDLGSESRFEWDYSDTRLDDCQEDTMDNYGWIDSRWSHQKPTNSGTGSTSGYSSSTLPRSMKLGTNKQRPKSSIYTDIDPGYHAIKGYRDDMALRGSTGAGAHGAGAHGYQGDRNHCQQAVHHRDQRAYYDDHHGYQREEVKSHYSTGSSSNLSSNRSSYHGNSYSGSHYGSHSSSTLPRQKKVSFKDFS